MNHPNQFPEIPQSPPMAGPPYQPPPAVPQPQKAKRFGWPTVIITGAVALFIGMLLMAGGSGDPYNPTAAPTAAAGEEDGYVDTPTEDAVTEDPTEPTKAPEPTLTRAQEEAVESAQSYIDSGGFSKRGLIDQLTSQYGEGFAKKDAEFAVAYIKPDWKAEAVESAESYLDSGGFSKSELLNQLESPYGEHFTHDQAVYAVNKVY